jgi:hypothetical protein
MTIVGFDLILGSEQFGKRIETESMQQAWGRKQLVSSVCEPAALDADKHNAD